MEERYESKISSIVCLDKLCFSLGDKVYEILL
jgi:hypothetical protein